MNYRYRNLFIKIENLILALSKLFSNSVTTTDEQIREKRNTVNGLCEDTATLWKKIGELKDGPVFSMAKLEVSPLMNEEFLKDLKNSNSSYNFNISDCGLPDYQLHIIKQGIQDLSTYLNNKNFKDDTEDWVEDESCVVGSPGSSKGIIGILTLLLEGTPNYSFTRFL